MRSAILSFLFLASVATGVQAQVAFGPEAGLVFSNYNGKADGQTSENKAKAGVTARPYVRNEWL